MTLTMKRLLPVILLALATPGCGIAVNALRSHGAPGA
jgi:hypothetical protein